MEENELLKEGGDDVPDESAKDDGHLIKGIHLLEEDENKEARVEQNAAPKEIDDDADSIVTLKFDDEDQDDKQWDTQLPEKPKDKGEEGKESEVGEGKTTIKAVEKEEIYDSGMAAEDILKLLMKTVIEDESVQAAKEAVKFAMKAAADITEGIEPKKFVYEPPPSPRSAGDKHFRPATTSSTDLLRIVSKESIIKEVSEETVPEKEVESESEAEVPEEVKIDRAAYVEIYKTLLQEKYILRRKNAILQRKLAENFKKRRMEHVYKDVEGLGPEVEQKYFKSLYAYEELKNNEEKERFTIDTELREMTKERNDLKVELKTTIDELISREQEIGSGLINSKTGKVIPAKVIDRYLNRQRNKLKEVAEVRLLYIRLRDNVASNEQALYDLENLGDGLHLIDYEQLRMENQSFSDKIEERDEELTRLRNKATSSIQILAHVREKAFATAMDIEEVSNNLFQLELEVINVREYVGKLKLRRDHLREETLRLRQEAGLLTQPRLLRDYEESIEECARSYAQLQNLKNTFHDKKRSIASVRSTITRVSASGIENLPKKEVLSARLLTTASRSRSQSRMGKSRRSFFPSSRSHERSIGQVYD